MRVLMILGLQGFGEVGLGDKVGKGEFVGSFDFVVEIDGDSGWIVVVTTEEVSYGFD